MLAGGGSVLAASIASHSAAHVSLADRAADTTARALQDLEDAVHVHAKKFNDLKASAEQKTKKVANLQTELHALKVQSSTISELEARTHLLTGGHPSGHDPLTAKVSMYEAVPGLVKFGDDDSNSEESDGFGSGSDSDGDGSSVDDRNSFGGAGNRTRAGGAAGKGRSKGGVGIGDGESSIGGSTLGPSASQIIGTSAASSLLSPSLMAGARMMGSASVNGGISHSDSIDIERMRKLRKQIKRTRRRVAKREFQKKQYVHMTDRLRANAESFERHMRGLEDAIKASKKELSEVTSYLRVLTASKEAVSLELAKATAQAALDKVARARKLEELRLVHMRGRWMAPAAHCCRMTMKYRPFQAPQATSLSCASLLFDRA